MRASLMKDVHCDTFDEALKMKGFLSKLGNGIVKTYSKRFFCFSQEGKHLEYYEKETDVSDKSKVKGRIGLSDIIRAETTEATEFRLFETKRIWVLRAANTEQRDKWVAAIGSVRDWINSHEDPRTVNAMKEQLFTQNDQLMMDRMKLEDETKNALLKLKFEKEIVEILKKQKEDLEGKNQDLNDTNTKLNTRVEELEEESSLNKKLISELETQIAQRVKNIEDLEGQIIQLEAQIKALQDEISLLKKTIDNLKDDINSRDNQITELGMRLEEKDQKIKALLDDIDKNQHTINDLLADKSKIMQEKQKFEALLEDEKANTARLEEENQKLKESLQKQETLNAELVEARKNSENEIQSLTTKLQESLWEQNKASEDLKIAKKELEEVSTALSHSENQLETANNDILELKRRLAEQEAEKLTANQTVEQLRQQLKEKDSNIEGHLAGEHENQQAINKLKQDLNNSKRENESLNEEIASYKGKLEAAEQALKDAEKLTQLEQENIQLKGEIEKLQAAAENASNRADSLSHENETLLEKVSELSKSVSQREEENRLLLSKYTLEGKTLSNKIEGLTNQLEHMEKSYQKSHAELLSLKEEMKQQKNLQKHNFSELERIYTSLIRNIFYGSQNEANINEELATGLQGCITQIPELAFLKELYELTNDEMLSLMRKLKSAEEGKMKVEELLNLQNKDISRKYEDLGRDNKLLNSQVMKYQREVRDQKEKLLATVEEFNYIFVNASKNIFTNEDDSRGETNPGIFRLDIISKDFKQVKILMELYVFLKEKTRKEIDGLKHNLSLRQKELAASTQENNDLRKKIHELESDLKAITQERDQLKQNNLESFNKVKEFSSLLNEELRDLMNRKSFKQTTGSERGQNIKKIASEFKQVSLAHEALEYLTSKLKEIQERYDETQSKYQVQIQKLNEDLKSLRARNSEVENQSRENEGLRVSFTNKLNEKDSTIKELKEKLALFETTLQKFEEFIRGGFSYGFASSFKEETTTKLKLWVKKEPVFIHFLNVFINICQNTEKGHTVFDSQVNRLNEEIANLQKEVKKLSAEKIQLKQKLDNLQKKELQQQEAFRNKDMAIGELRRILARIEEVCLLLSTNIRELYGENPQEHLPNYSLKDRLYRMKQIIESIPHIKELGKIYEYLRIKTGVSDKDLSMLEFKATHLQKERANYLQMYESILSQEPVILSNNGNGSYKTPSRQRKVEFSMEEDEEIASVKKLDSSKNSITQLSSATPKSTKVKTTNFVQSTPTGNASSPKYFKSVGSNKKSNLDPNNIELHKSSPDLSVKKKQIL